MTSNSMAQGTGDSTVEFDRPVNHVNFSIASGVSFSFSVDDGITFITLAAGFHGVPIGTYKEIQIRADGAWQLIAIQS